jgi:3-oxoacyl-[acyl-carrier protein] reductase
VTTAHFRLDDRAALITGAASGIGAATAVMFAEAGADVVIPRYAADPHDVEPVVKCVQSAGRRAVVVECDVRRREDVDRVVAESIDVLGRLDIVIANAGIIRQAPSTNLSDEDVLDLIDVDLVGVFRCFRAALPHMIKARWGRLLATSSVAGSNQGWPRRAHYGAAKAGIIGLVRGLATEFAPFGITVNAVVPGTIASPQSLDPVNSLGPQAMQQMAQDVPVGRIGSPADVAAAFLYLASPEAAFVTGQALVVDGGLTVAPPPMGR